MSTTSDRCRAACVRAGCTSPPSWRSRRRSPARRTSIGSPPARLPGRRREGGLPAPPFLASEPPSPGPPYFHRLARGQAAGAQGGRASRFLPHALLRDFTSYTLVVEPSLASPHDYIAAYRETLAEI